MPTAPPGRTRRPHPGPATAPPVPLSHPEHSRSVTLQCRPLEKPPLRGGKAKQWFGGGKAKPTCWKDADGGSPDDLIYSPGDLIYRPDDLTYTKPRPAAGAGLPQPLSQPALGNPVVINHSSNNSKLNAPSHSNRCLHKATQFS